jgi:UDP-2-acetamido-3-amino-2,3-dideoxy-glucuronate N-acetyltransferase
MIHHLADVQSENIGANTNIWQFSVILPNAIIGDNCNINCHTFIENDVVIGNNVTVKSGVYLWNGLTVEDNVFIGPSVSFINDKYPRSKQYPNTYQRTYLKKNCTIGANATILGEITIGSYSLIGAGSVITKNVPDYAIITGNPGKIVGFVSEKGNKLLKTSDDEYQDEQSGKKFIFRNNKLEKA